MEEGGYSSLAPPLNLLLGIVGKLGGGRFCKFTLFEKKAWQINRSAKRLLSLIIDLDGFSLVYF